MERIGTKNSWMSNSVGSWMVRDIRRPLGYFNVRPSMKQIMNLFAHRKRGTIYFELWKNTGVVGRRFESRLRVQMPTYEYKLVDRREIPVRR